MSVNFDQAAAKAALRLIQISHDNWTAGLAALAGKDMTGADWQNLALQQYAHAVAVLTWARGLDDMCRDNPAQLPGYASARPQSEVFLGAARYACNRAVHQLITLNQPVGGFGFPMKFPFGFNNLIHFRWAPEAFLPDPQTERPNQAPLRAHYVARFAGEEVTPGLDQLRIWFEAHVR